MMDGEGRTGGTKKATLENKREKKQNKLFLWPFINVARLVASLYNRLGFL